MQACSWNELSSFVGDNREKIKDIKVTKETVGSFNDMEGLHFTYNIKIVTGDKYKNKMVQLETNSTYFDWYMSEDDEDTTQKDFVQEFFNNLLPIKWEF